MKHDGFRALARTRAAVALGEIDGEAFPEVVHALTSIGRNLVLDWELVVPDQNGRSDFEEVPRRNLLQLPRMILDAATRRPAARVVFDLLEIDGDDLRTLALFEQCVFEARRHRVARLTAVGRVTDCKVWRDVMESRRPV